MALNIQPSSSSSSSGNASSSLNSKTSSTDLFAQGMAAAAQNAQQSSSSKQSQSSQAAKSSKPAGTTKSKHSSDDSQSKSKTSSTSAKSSQQGSQSSQSAAASQTDQADQAAQAATAADDAAAAAEASAAAKARAAVKTPAKANSTQTDAAAKAEATDPSDDSTNQSGLSLIQLLAKSLQSDDSTAPATGDDGTATTAATDKSGTDSTDPGSDPNAIALAMFSQALAAALGRQQTFANAPTTGTSDATTAITGGTASTQDLLAVLAKDVSADAKGKSDDAAAQFNVDTTKDASTDSGTADASTTAGPNALTHLGIASHFAAQHLQGNTNTADIKATVGSSAWEDEVGTHLTWMTQKGLETGSLRVTPEHLGPVEVNISVQNGDASVWFAANHPDTRAALEQALPKLREMFANQGMNLADSGVSRQSLSQQDSRSQNRSSGSQGVTAVSAVSGSDGTSAASARLNLGLVDLYA